MLGADAAFELQRRRHLVLLGAELARQDRKALDLLEARELRVRLVDDVNGELSRFEQIKRFVILPREFSAEEGEVTPTLKLKRRVCAEHFAREIEELYA